MLLECLPVDMLSKHVCRIGRARDLGEEELSRSDLVLGPKICSVQMSGFPKSSPTTDADGRCSIGLNFKGRLDTKVC